MKTNHILNEVGCRCCQNYLSNHDVKNEAFQQKMLNASPLSKNIVDSKIIYNRKIES